MDYMAEEKDLSPRPAATGASKEEIALELMRFIASTTGMGRTSTGAGFAGKVPKASDDQVEMLLSLYARCREAVK